MSKANRTPGIRPGSTRDATQFNTQVADLASVLGQTAGPAGAVQADNFSAFAGISEEKFVFQGAPLGHSHSAVGNDGAEVAEAVITDLQMKWHQTGVNAPQLIRGASPGMIVNAGFWNNSRWTGMSPSPSFFDSVVVYTGGYNGDDDRETEPEPEDYRVYFSTGLLAASDDEQGEPFPPGAVPNVIITPVIRVAIPDSPYVVGNFMDDIRDKNYNGVSGFGYAQPLSNDALWRISYTITTVNHQFFDIRLHVPSLDEHKGEFVTSFFGFNWVAMYDPTAEEPF